MIKPGVSTDKVAEVRPKAEEFGLGDEASAFGLQFGHDLGLALETCYPAARIEQDVVVTPTGCEVIRLFPAEDLPIANRY
ncbi:hypothetical protein RA2_01193 [Roseovarius sp. A-2]|nr:hypothetical protein RA2_01193 [Roseovarius sp. A-2]